MNLDLFKTETAQMAARKSVTILATLLVGHGVKLSKGWYETATEIVAGLILFAISWALSKWNVKAKISVIDNLQTVVETKHDEIQTLRAVVADSHAETGVLINTLIEAKVPIPELPPTKPVGSDPAADLPNLSKP